MSRDRDDTTYVALVTIKAITGATCVYGVTDFMDVVREGAKQLGYKHSVSYFNKPLKVKNFDCEINIKLEPKE